MIQVLEEIRNITWDTYKALQSNPSNASVMQMVGTVYEYTIKTLESYWLDDGASKKRRNTWERRTETLVKSRDLK
jgi:hypothetical protein